MVYELRVKSFEQLEGLLEGLEVDTGVRAFGEFRGRKSVIFITRHSGKYHLWVRGRGRKGEKGSFLDFDEFKDLHAFLERALDRPVQARVY